MLASSGATQESIARKCGVSQQAVGKWLDGTSRPGAPARTRLFEAYGIAPRAWDEPYVPGTIPDLDSTSRVPPPSRLELEASGLAGAVPDLDVPAPVVQIPEGLEAQIELVQRRARRVLSRLEQEADGLTVEGEGDAVAAVLKLLERLDALKQRALGRNVLKLPQWKQLESTVEIALRPYPEAATAVAEALERLDVDLNA